MKKIFTGAVAAFVMMGSTFAQSTDNRGGSNSLHFGIRGGVNLATIVEEDDAPEFSSELKPGVQAGVYLTLPLSKAFSVQPEVLFSQKGYRADRTGLLGSYKYRVTTNYIDVPLLAKFTPAKNFGIVVGPQFSFLTNTNTKLTSGGAQFESNVDNETNDLRNNILGGVAGLEAGITDNITISARYALDFQKNNSDGNSSTLKYRNQVISFTVGLQL